MSNLISTSNSRTRPRPFVKWVSGKTQLLNRIHQRLPATMGDSGQLNTDVEPFVESGAVFFHLVDHFQIRHAVLVGINRELMVAYRGRTGRGWPH